MCKWICTCMNLVGTYGTEENVLISEVCPD